MKKIIRLTENDLHKIIENSVRRIIKESYYDDPRLDPESIFYDPTDAANDEPLNAPLSKEEEINQSWNDYNNMEEYDNEDYDEIDKLGDEYWTDHEDRKKAEKYPYLYKKDGKNIRSAKEIEKYMNNRSKGGFHRAADQERLHRKNSLNREI